MVPILQGVRIVVDQWKFDEIPASDERRILKQTWPKILLQLCKHAKEFTWEKNYCLQTVFINTWHTIK
jgi:hypothetical protein